MRKRWLEGPLTWVVPLLVEVVLYLQYRTKDARFHWFTHFLVGGTAALLLMTLWVIVTRRPARFAPAWVLGGHLVAMFPDLLFEGGHIHEPWMDLFLWHIGSHFVPGRNLTWLAAFMVALALYLVGLDRRCRAPGEVAQRPETRGRGGARR